MPLVQLLTSSLIGRHLVLRLRGGGAPLPEEDKFTLARVGVGSSVDKVCTVDGAELVG